MIWLFISGLVIPFIFYFSDLLGKAIYQLFVVT